MRKKFDKIGLEAFCPIPHKVPSRLSEEQEARLKGIILEGAPTKYGFNFWCGKSLSLVIKLVFGIILGVRQCQKLFHKLGFSFIRPTTIPKKAEKFKKEREEFRKKLKEIRKDPNRVIMFMDEVHFKLGTSVKKSWFIKGSNPHVKANVERGKLLYCGFVNPLTGELLTYELTVFNYLTMIFSVQSLVREYKINDNQKIIIILDNASWHKKCVRIIRENFNNQFAEINKKVEFMFLPPYSPDLNPIELVWRETRANCTHNICHADIDSMYKKLEEYFEAHRKSNETLRSLCLFE